MQRLTTRVAGALRAAPLRTTSSLTLAPRRTLAPLSSRFMTEQASAMGGGASLGVENQHKIDSELAAEMAYGHNSMDTQFEESRIDTSQSSDPTNRTFSYVVTGSAAFMYASFGRSAVNKFVSYLSATADVMALAAMEVDISAIEEGTATTVKWRGKPVFIRNRTAKEIESAKADDTAHLRDQETDAERFPLNDRYAVLIGVCTHLGCVPINGAGDYGGWFCPCHGSHYDTSGRIRKGPAPLNLAVPQYKFLSETKILLG